MKVFANNIIKDFALTRIEKAFKKYSPPEIKFVDNEDEADLVIVYAFAQRRKIWWRVNKLINAGKKYAVVQTALRSTTNPKSYDWLNIWKNAELVWSYYDLPRIFNEDNNIKIPCPPFHFYHAPLGVDPDVFKETTHEKKYMIAIGGNRQESIKEVFDVLMEPDKDNIYMLGSGIDDESLARFYSQCRYVSGLRRVEGFELPVIEGLLCGARPIVYDKPHYRKWFEDIALLIPEGTREEVAGALRYIFANEYWPVTDEEKEKVKNRFNWKTIISGFWEHI